MRFWSPTYPFILGMVQKSHSQPPGMVLKPYKQATSTGDRRISVPSTGSMATSPPNFFKVIQLDSVNRTIPGMEVMIKNQTPLKRSRKITFPKRVTQKIAFGGQSKHRMWIQFITKKHVNIKAGGKQTPAKTSHRWFVCLASHFFFARSCLGKVPGGAPFSQRSERATACTIRMQIVKQIIKATN